MSDSCGPLDCSLLGSSVHGISQARILEWIAIHLSRGSSQLRDRTHVSCIDRQILYLWATRKATLVCVIKGQMAVCFLQFSFPLEIHFIHNIVILKHLKRSSDYHIHPEKTSMAAYRTKSKFLSSALTNRTKLLQFQTNWITYCFQRMFYLVPVVFPT